MIAGAISQPRPAHADLARRLELPERRHAGEVTGSGVGKETMSSRRWAARSISCGAASANRSRRSRNTTRRFSDATTGSLDALSRLASAMSTRRRQGDAASLPFFKKAVEQDPDFALAHARLGTVYGQHGGAGAVALAHQQGVRTEETASASPSVSTSPRATSPPSKWPRRRRSTPTRSGFRPIRSDFVPHANVAGLCEGRGEHEKRRRSTAPQSRSPPTSRCRTRTSPACSTRCRSQTKRVRRSRVRLRAASSTRRSTTISTRSRSSGTTKQKWRARSKRRVDSRWIPDPGRAARYRAVLRPADARPGSRPGSTPGSRCRRPV